MIGNTFKKVGRFGKIESYNDLVLNQEQKTNLVLKENNVEGDSKIAFNKPSANQIQNVIMTDNYFKSISDVLLFSGFPINGTLWASDNVWDTVLPQGYPHTGVHIFHSSGTTTNSMDRIVFISNVITGERTMTSISLPPAETSIQKNNSI